MGLIERMRLRLAVGSGSPQVFVSGMVKSGTTAVLELVARCSGLSSVNDPLYRLDRAGVQYLDALFDGSVALPDLMRRYPGAFRGQVVKDPSLVFFREQLAVSFPGSKWIFTVRDPRDNIRSVLNRLRLPGRSGPIAGLPPGINDTWRRIIEGRTPDLPGHNPVEVLAARWEKVAALIPADSPSGVTCRYEDFVKDKEQYIRGLCQKIGLQPRHSISDVVDQDFQPRGDRNVNLVEFFGEDQLEVIQSICANGMRRFGYS